MSAPFTIDAATADGLYDDGPVAELSFLVVDRDEFAALASGFPVGAEIRVDVASLWEITGIVTGVDEKRSVLTVIV